MLFVGVGLWFLRQNDDSTKKMRDFQVTFIQNPYNNFSLPLDDIKIDQKFIVTGINETGYEMTLV